MNKKNIALKALCLSFVLVAPLYSSSSQSWWKKPFALWAGAFIALDGASAESNAGNGKQICSNLRFLQDVAVVPPSMPHLYRDGLKIVSATNSALEGCDEIENGAPSSPKNDLKRAKKYYEIKSDLADLDFQIAASLETEFGEQRAKDFLEVCGDINKLLVENQSQ